MEHDDNYPHLDKFSRSIGIPSENLVKAFEIEKTFHSRILEEGSFDERQKMYADVYSAVHPLYGKDKTNIQSGGNPKDGIVRLFANELKDRSILDVGCGEGYFLASVEKNLPHKKLAGIDVSIPKLSRQHPNIEFKLGNVIRFNMEHQFDVVFSDQVIEHIAPADLPDHLASIRSSLKPGGIFIVNMPNRLFGPADVTRIIDCSNTGKIKAQGTHLNESTYTELIPLLENNGFHDFKTVCPLPKLKHLFANYRMRPSLLLAAERSRLILGMLHSIKVRGRCIAQFGVTLICTKC